MTAQFPEKLRYKNEDYAMHYNPLSDYFTMAEVKPDFQSPHTALWRGYVGSWQIIDDRLYLVNLRGTYKDGKTVTIASIFPDFPDRVFAHWVNGNIKVPLGEILEYVHMGYGSIYESDLFLYFENGVLKSTRTKDNRTADDISPEDWYDPEAITVVSERLINQHKIKDIELSEVVIDPLFAVSGKPFGHLNNAWLRFFATSRIGDELWSFTSKESAPHNTFHYKAGYVLVRDNSPKTYFLTLNKLYDNDLIGF